MLFVSPLILIALGLLVARIAKAKRVWRRHGWFAWYAGLFILVAHTLVALGLLFDVDRLAPWVAAAGASSGTDLFFGSGLVSWGLDWPVTDGRWMALAVVSFMLHPFWYMLGVEAGAWLFGRSPKQTGLLGLLR